MVKMTMMMKSHNILQAVFSVLVCLANLASTADLDVTNCKKTVKRGDGIVCYSVVGTQNTWSGAAELCTARSMKLLTVLTQTENDAVVDLLESNSFVDSWLSASATMDHWKWLDGTEIRDHGCFRDDPSDRDLETMTTIADNTESLCVQYCQGLNYAYAGLQAATQCWCGNTFGRYGQIGAVCQMSCPGMGGTNCGGTSSQIIISIRGSYSNWEPSQPDNGLNIQNCATLDGSDVKATWRDVDCRDTNWALCIIADPRFDCRQRGALWTRAGRCLYVVQKPLSYFNARFECGKLGGDLVMIKSQEENTEIANFLVQQFPHNDFRYWIGLVKQQWNWQTDELFLYNNWASSEPTGLAGSCATIKRGNTVDDKGLWGTVDCSSQRYFICQSTNSSRNSTLSGVIPNPAGSTTRSPIGPITAPPVSRRPGSPGGPGSSGSPGGSPGDGKPTKKNELSKAALGGIIGGSVGGFLLIVLIIVLIIVCSCCCPCCCCYRDRQNKKNASGSGTTNNSNDAHIDVGPAYFFGMDSNTPTITTLGKEKKTPKIDNPDVVPSYEREAL